MKKRYESQVPWDVRCNAGYINQCHPKLPSNIAQLFSVVVASVVCYVREFFNETNKIN